VQAVGIWRLQRRGGTYDLPLHCVNTDTSHNEQRPPATSCRIAETLARDPRHIIRARFARLKGDRTPVTDADEARKAIILSGAAELFPGRHLRCRGSCGTRAACGPRYGRFLLIDPLDGNT